MTIGAAIMALSPTLYWPLDDPTGPAASDASGNGNAGIYGGSFSLGLNGPEVGTAAALFGDYGSVFTVAGTPILARPFSLLIWIGLEGIQGTLNTIIYNGNGAVNGTGGLYAAGGAISQPVEVLIGGHANGAPVGALGLAQWHQYVLTVDAAQITNQWIDSTNVYLNVNTGAWTAPSAGDPFTVGNPRPQQFVYYAHAALFNYVLSGAQVASVVTARTAPQEPSNVPGVTGFDIERIIARLDAILAAVRRTY